MSQQATIMSGVPKLTPLPTYQNQIVDERYSYTPTLEPELRYTPEIEQNGFPFSRGATPQTPSGPVGDDGSLPTIGDLGYLDCHAWAGDGLVPVGLGFGDMDMTIPDHSWMTPEPSVMGNANYFTQHMVLSSMEDPQDGFNTPLVMPTDWSSIQMSLPDETISEEKALDDGVDSGIVMQGEWAHSMPAQQDMYLDMGNMITSAPYVPKMQAMSSNAPVWEDVFISSSIPY